ncbi:hypothetical protein F3087_27495 [Nocardia colli]|uniref:Uncharacterized protein n=1 Tax=Nocardia colli TaxID=2545717 RepID=A0A5N0E7J1_9NOCA|nr:hypothetical protein F3087_27495 [Nocardia colli]
MVERLQPWHVLNHREQRRPDRNQRRRLPFPRRKERDQRTSLVRRAIQHGDIIDGEFGIAGQTIENRDDRRGRGPVVDLLTDLAQQVRPRVGDEFADEQHPPHNRPLSRYSDRRHNHHTSNSTNISAEVRHGPAGRLVGSAINPEHRPE